MHLHPQVLPVAVERGQPERHNLICCLSLVALQHLEPTSNLHSSSTGLWEHANGGEGLHPSRDGAQGLGRPRCRTGDVKHIHVELVVFREVAVVRYVGMKDIFRPKLADVNGEEL